MTCPTCQGDRFINTNANSPDVPCPTCSGAKGPDESVLLNRRTPVALSWVLREEIEISKERLHGLTLEDAAQEVGDLDMLRRLLAEVGGDKDELAKIQADISAMSESVQVRRSRHDAIHEQVRADYEALKGKVVLLSEVECYDEKDCSVTVYCDPPAVARIAVYSPEQLRQCIERWTSHSNCDPVYDVSILETHPAFSSGLRPSWAFGTCYSLAGTPPEKAAIEVADADMQALYAEAPALPDDACAPPPAP
jgi:hypothetical protein